MLSQCPRCGKAEKQRHKCTGNLEAVDNNRRSAARQERKNADPMVPIEVTWTTRDALDKIRQELVVRKGKSPVFYDEAIELLFGYYRKAMLDNKENS